MDLEAIVLTGGASRRMGEDKARLQIDGLPMAERIVGQLLDAGIPVTVMGREPVTRAAFIADSEEFAGPLAALAAFEPSAEFVFVASCDLPLFDPHVIRLMEQSIGDCEVIVPTIDGRLQPLCALYRATAFPKAKLVFLEGRRSVIAWIERLTITEIREEQFQAANLNIASVLGVNTPADLANVLKLAGQ